MTRDVDDNVARGRGPVYLVLEHDALISSDLVGTLEARAGARVICASDANQIPALLEGVDHLDAAFLEMHLGQFVQNGLDKMMERLGARVVFTVDEDNKDTAARRGWEMLIRPFSDEMVYSILRRFPLRP